MTPPHATRRSLLHVALAACAWCGNAVSAQTVPAPVGGNTTLADRVRGAPVYDDAGIPIGAIDSSLDTLVTILVDQYKIQFPVSGLRKEASGRLVSTLDRGEIASLMAQSARYQEQTHPIPSAPPMPAFQPPTGPPPPKGKDTPAE